ncbi:formylglycine-generating enzyme family protein [Crocosphaera sp. Alani8]|uniref:formylglycine-generating enzyme family protein n=1 Tax=Crocosphaera sp. Alani8 TaxID=3038952 RepID=UPI00313BFE02
MAEKMIIKRLKQKFRAYRDYIDDVPLEMVLIPDGTFTMGAPEDEEGSLQNETPQHEVTISSFLMGRYPVTQGQWKAIATKTDLKFKIDLQEDPSQFKQSYKGIERWQRPVECVSWYEAIEFCQRLSKLTGKDYKLPSEAQWEYACRAGTPAPFHFGETITRELANYRGTDNEEYQLSKSYSKVLKEDYREQTTPVGYFDVTNAFGLFDMHGNVREWCADDWHDSYKGAPNYGSPWLNGNENRSPLRGGSWINYQSNCRSAYRDLDNRRADRNHCIGFRVVCVLRKTP